MANRLDPMHDNIQLGHHVHAPAVRPTAGQVALATDRTTELSPAMRRLAVRACESCRQMKVKCVTFDNPPCVRCRKARRECIFPISLQSRDQYPDDVTRVRARKVAPAVAPDKPFSDSGDFERADQPPRNVVGVPGVSPSDNVDTPDGWGPPSLPSIYSTAPLDAMNELSTDHVGPSPLQTGDQRSSAGLQGQEAIWNFTNNSNALASEAGINIPKRDLRGMIKIFREKLLPYMCVLPVQDFQDADRLIETDPPLVYCICYVTARFLPGGKQLREMLMPKIAQIMKGNFTSGRNSANEMSTLKALAILYTYANVSSPSPQDSEATRHEDILFWPLKSLVEVYGLRLSLNRSLYDLQAEMRSERSKPITESTSYQKYTFWLHLFTMAKFTSVMSGTPPSIPVDSTIRAAPLIMEEIGMNPQAALFSEVELANIWEKIGTKNEFGEWWCRRDISKIIDERETESLLREGGQLLDTWYHKWANVINDEDGQGAVLDYYGRCSRFTINSYATKHLSSSPAGLTPIQTNQARNCVIYASRVLDWPLDLSPFQKESLRYISESGGVMVSFCCLYILASCQTFGSSIPDLLNSLDKVTMAAQLMINVAPDVEHNLHIQGLLILKRAEVLRTHSKTQESSSSDAQLAESNILTGLTSQEFMGEEFDFNSNCEGMSAMDLFWDFPILPPRTW